MLSKRQRIPQWTKPTPWWSISGYSGMNITGNRPTPSHQRTDWNKALEKGSFFWRSGGTPDVVETQKSPFHIFRGQMAPFAHGTHFCTWGNVGIFKMLHRSTVCTASQPDLTFPKSVLHKVKYDKGRRSFQDGLCDAFLSLRDEKEEQEDSVLAHRHRS